MPADSETYIHPIIQAMIESAQLKSHSLDRQNQSDQEKERAKQRREELKATIARAEQEHKINLGHLDLQRQQYDLAVNDFKTRAQHGILEDIRTGTRPVESLPSAPTIPTALNSAPGDPSQIQNPGPTSGLPPPNFSQMPTPGPSSSQEGNVDVGGMSMPRAAVAQIPQNAIRIAGQREAAVAKARDEALAPLQEKRDQKAYDRAIEVANIGADRAENVARINAAAGYSRSELAMLTRMMALNGGMQVDPDVALSKYNAVLDGQTGYTSLSKQEKAAVDKIAAMRHTSLPTNQAAYQKKLDQLGGIQGLIEDYRDLAKNYSKDSPEATFIQRIPGVNRLIDSTKIPGTDLKSKADALKAQGGALASYFDQQNRKSDAEILRQFTGLFDSKSTAAQNLDKIESHVKTLRKSVKGNFAGINSEDVQRILSERGSHDLLEEMNGGGGAAPTQALPDFLKVAPQKNKNGTALNVEESIKRGSPVYGGN